jgi:hypothetical protein
MPLKFECNQDPRKMKSINGKKFCDQCQQHVYDVRRKSVEKIIQLKKEQAKCCLLIYEDQLEAVESKLGSGNVKEKTTTRNLPIAAGIAAVTLFGPEIMAQNSSAKIQTETRSRDQQGKAVTPPASATETDLNEIKGTVNKNSHSFGKKNLSEKFEIGYYEGDEFVCVKKFKSKKSGAFEFALTNDQVKLLQANEFEIKCAKRSVYWDNFSFKNRNELLNIHVRAKHRRAVMGVAAYD